MLAQTATAIFKASAAQSMPAILSSSRLAKSFTPAFAAAVSCMLPKPPTLAMDALFTLAPAASLRPSSAKRGRKSVPRPIECR